MSWNREAYSDTEWKDVNEGRLCPNSECKSDNITYVGYAYDGINMNCAYDCVECGQEWEGD